jgi:hypothetical protein
MAVWDSSSFNVAVRLATSKITSHVFGLFPHLVEAALKVFVHMVSVGNYAGSIFRLAAAKASTKPIPATPAHGRANKASPNRV